MAQIPPETHPQREGYVSGSKFFFYSCSHQEIGTNKRHPASAELSHLIVNGLDAYEQWRLHVQGIKPSEHEVYEITDEDGNLVAIRVEDPQLIFDGLRGCMEMLPMEETTADQRGLASWAEQDLHGFIGWLGAAGIHSFEVS